MFNFKDLSDKAEDFNAQDYLLSPDKFFEKRRTTKKIYVFDPVNELKSLEYKTKKSLCFISDKSHFSPHGHKNLSNFLEKKIDKFGILKKTKKIHKTIKKRKENYILGISAFYHDSAASLIKNGKVIAASQE